MSVIDRKDIIKTGSTEAVYENVELNLVDSGYGSVADSCVQGNELGVP